MARNAYTYEKFMREKKKAAKKAQREADKKARREAKAEKEDDGPSAPRTADGADATRPDGPAGDGGDTTAGQAPSDEARRPEDAPGT
jgi:hypothetical protein